MNILEQVKERWEDNRMRAKHKLLQPRLADFRLLPPALGLWCFTAIVFLCSFTTALLFLVLLCCLLCLAYGALMYRWPKNLTSNEPRVKTCLIFTLIICCLQALIMASSNYPQKLALLDELKDKDVRFSGQVLASEPAQLTGYKTTVSSNWISQYPNTYNLSINFSIYTDKLFVPGSLVSGVGTLRCLGSHYSLKGTLRYTEAPSPEDIIFTLKNKIRDTAISRVGADNAGLILGMAYGDDSSLTNDSLTALRVAGLTHLTAVSGSNITLIFLIAYRFAQSLGLTRLFLVVGGLTAAGLYVWIVGPDGSVIRAWTMGLLGAVGLLLGHGAYRVALLSSCLISLLFVSPELATDIGFVLSVTATASLLILAPALSRIMCHIFPQVCADLLSIPLVASLWCSPVILILSKGIYPYTVLANILVAPLVAPITLVGLAIFILFGLHCPEKLIEFLLDLGGSIAQCVHVVSRWSYNLPYSRIAIEVNPTSLLLTLVAVGTISLVILKTDAKLHSNNNPRTPYLLAHW